MSSKRAPLPPATVAGDPAESSPELRKPHEMIVMVPRSRRVTMTGRRLYNAMLQVSQSRLAAMEAMPQADFMFEAPLPALLRTTGSDGEDRTAAKRYLREMRGLEVDWESTAPGDGLKWRGFSMLSEVSIEVRNGENWVAWSYPPTIMSALREPARWARIDLNVLASLSTYAAIALYEICARYRDNPSGLTSRKLVAWWADALSSAPAGSERREWRKFKNERVKPAIDEINAETDLEVGLIEHKQGRAVTEAQFSVRRKKEPVLLRTSREGTVDANLVLRAESLGVREIKVDALVREFGEESVRDKIGVLERRVARGDLPAIDNAYSYLRSLLRMDDEADSHGQDGLPDDKVMAEKVVAEREGGAPAQSAWLNQHIDALKSEILGLGPAQQEVYKQQALQELSQKQLLSAVVRRRVSQGDWLHGLLGSVVVRLYATQVYGPDWAQAARKDDVSSVY